MTSWRRPLPLAIALMLAVLTLKVTGLVQSVRPALVVRQAAAATDPARPASPARAAIPAAASLLQHSHPLQRAPRRPLPSFRPTRPSLRRSEHCSRTCAVDGWRSTGASRRLRRGESLLAAAEQRLTARVGELQALQNRLEALEAARRERDEANWRGLVRTYEAMKPKDAAAILTELDQAVLLQVLDRMKEAKAAPILSAMPPDRARAITAELAQMRTRANAPIEDNRG